MNSIREGLEEVRKITTDWLIDQNMDSTTSMAHVAAVLLNTSFGPPADTESRAIDINPVPSVDADGWIKWDCGDCPVSEGTIVDVRYRDRVEMFACMALFPGAGRCASRYFWSHDNDPGDIVAYRLSAPATPVS
mgnify:CR=1 FL=1